LLQDAQHNLETEFSFVGLVERFDESVLLLKKQLGWKNAYYLKRNTGSSKESPVVELAEGTLERLRAKNALDIKLYHYARQQFQQQIDSLGSEFERELANFRRRNNILNQTVAPLYNPYERAKLALKKHLF